MIDRCFDAQRAHDRRQRAIERDQAQVRAATAGDVARLARSYAWRHTDARKRDHAKQAYLWGCAAQVVEDEITRRQRAGD